MDGHSERLKFVLKTVQQYAEDGFIIPSGVRGGMRYRPEVNPPTHGVLGIYDEFLRAEDARELYLIAGNQVGKTLSLTCLGCYVITELNEDLLVFGPTFQVAHAVAQDILRSLEYQGYEIERGTYSARISNGVVLTWRGQSDSQRAQVTSRIVLVTEAEKIKQKRTEEAHPIDQIRARVMSFRNGKIIFESTLTSETGLMWTMHLLADRKFRYYHRCNECGELFIPDVGDVGFSYYACSVCGTAIDAEFRADCVRGGCFVCEGDGGRVWSIRYTAFDGLLVNPLEDMVYLRESKDVNAQRRLYLQYLAEPPKMVFTAPKDPVGGLHRRGQVDVGDFWAIGVDVGVSNAHYVLLSYTPGTDRIKIVDFGKCRGSLQNQVDILKSIISSLNPERGVLLFDYGFNGAHLLRLWQKARVNQRVLPVRGINERSFVIDPSVDLKYGDFWRYRRMLRNGVYSIQVYTTAAKDAVFGLLYTGRLLMFANDGNDITIRQFNDSICRSEQPIEKNGERIYERVGENNHYFDAMVYALTGLLFAGAPIDVTALPRIESASMVAVTEEPIIEVGGSLVIDDTEEKKRVLKTRESKGDILI